MTYYGLSHEALSTTETFQSLQKSVPSTVSTSTPTDTITTRSESSMDWWIYNLEWILRILNYSLIYNLKQYTTTSLCQFSILFYKLSLCTVISHMLPILKEVGGRCLENIPEEEWKSYRGKEILQELIRFFGNEGVFAGLDGKRAKQLKRRLAYRAICGDFTNMVKKKKFNFFYIFILCIL